jgi:hypothetical protein
VLEQLRTDPAIILNQNAINQIAVQGLDIWDVEKPTNQNTHLLCQHALHAYAAHASTQHNNEQLVKHGALMALTGKSEIMASIFAIVSNDFMTEHHEKQEDNDLEEPDNQPAVAQQQGAAEDNNGPQ